jgi:uncharacterized cupredoxin-like copper-binding protein
VEFLRPLPARMVTAALGAALVAGCAAKQQLAAPGRVVDVTERDFKITVSQRTLQAGSVVFRDTNRGPDKHELIVAHVGDPKLPLRSDGLTVSEERLEKSIVGTLEPGAPNSVRELRLRLKPGHYVLFCNMSGHFMGGMRADLVVR